MALSTAVKAVEKYYNAACNHLILCQIYIFIACIWWRAPTLSSTTNFHQESFFLLRCHADIIIIIIEHCTRRQIISAGLPLNRSKYSAVPFIFLLSGAFKDFSFPLCNAMKSSPDTKMNDVLKLHRQQKNGKGANIDNRGWEWPFHNISLFGAVCVCSFRCCVVESKKRKITIITAVIIIVSILPALLLMIKIDSYGSNEKNEW